MGCACRARRGTYRTVWTVSVHNTSASSSRPGQRLAGLAVPGWGRTGSAPQVLHNFHLFERRLEQHRRIAHGFERGPAAIFGSAARELTCHAISFPQVTCPLVRLPDAFQRFSITLACFPRFFSLLPETFRLRARPFDVVPLWSHDISLRHECTFQIA